LLQVTIIGTNGLPGTEPLRKDRSSTAAKSLTSSILAMIRSNSDRRALAAASVFTSFHSSISEISSEASAVRNTRRAMGSSISSTRT
jgi:hypothetical protein